MEQLNQIYLESDDLESSGITWESKADKGNEPSTVYESRSYEWLFDSSIRFNVLNNHPAENKALEGPQKKMEGRLSVKLSPTKAAELKNQRSPLNSFLREVVGCKKQKATS